jgi:hypothetical protein
MVLKVELPLKEDVEPYRVERRRESDISYTIGSQMAVRFSTLDAGPFWLRNIPGTKFC